MSGSVISLIEIYLSDVMKFGARMSSSRLATGSLNTDETPAYLPETKQQIRSCERDDGASHRKLAIKKVFSVDIATYEYFELDLDLPDQLTKPVISALQTLARKACLTKAFSNSLVESLRSLVYFEAAKQLYATMLDDEKSKVEDLRAVYNNKSMVPICITRVLAVIGLRDTVYGKTLVRDAPYLFRYWVFVGCQFVSKPRPLWRDPISKSYLNS